MSLPGTHNMGATIDHLVPVSAGGKDSLSNVRLAHRSCNCARGVGGSVQLMLG
jgi:5-methylcytosine-specific restriction endonuclease McrA